MIDTIAFDFGQVIGFFDHGRMFRELVKHTNFSEQEMYAAFFTSDLEDAFESGRIHEPEFLRRFHELCQLRCGHEFLAAAAADIFWPNEALCALIPQLKNRYRLVLGSNTNPIHARHFTMQFADTLRNFDALVLSHEVGARKPSAVFFQHLIAAAACSPERCVFIDDLSANVAGARACGLQGVVYRDMVSLENDLRKLGADWK